MLRLLLDHHISPDAAEAARRQAPAIQIQHVQDLRWQRLPDRELLMAAYRETLTLVTYDLSTIPRTLREFSEREQPHAGVVFVDGHTIPSNDRGAIAARWLACGDANGMQIGRTALAGWSAAVNSRLHSPIND